MNTLEKLAAIEKAKVIYNIVYRNAGVAFMFFEGEVEAHRIDYKRYLKIDRYYPTFEEAVDAEYKRL